MRDVVRSGLSDAQVDWLFHQLPRPMNFDPAGVAYNFSLGWVEVAPPPEPDVDEFMEEQLDGWLEGLAEAEVERLVELRDRLDALIAAQESSDPDDVPPSSEDEESAP